MIFSEPIPSFIADLCSSLSTSKRSRFKNKSNYAKSEPSYKGRFSFTSEVTVMGQNQGKGPINVGEFTGPSNLFQPDQHGYHFHPASPEPAHSAPFALKDDQSDPFSRGDCTPGGTLSKSRGSISRPRNLAKKLSQRSKGSHGPSRSVGAKMQAFEEMVNDAELRAGFDVISPNSQPSITSQPAVRSAASNDFFFGPKTTSSIETSALHQTIPLPATTALTRPGHHRRLSSTSVKSARISIKSSKRAEREWRARVAALAHAPSPHSNRAELRGPVPPKRTPASTRYVYPVDSPPSEAIITPPPSDQANVDTPAKSFVSNMSFETLGHYHQPPIKADLISSDPSVRDRRASVPQSVVSLFYFDPTPGSRISTRPSSFAVTQVLSTVPAESSSPLRPSPPDEVSEEPKVTPITPKSRKLSIPPFKSLQLAAGSVSSKPPSSPALPESNIKPSLKIRRDKHASDTPQLGLTSGSIQSDLQVTINGDSQHLKPTTSIGCSQRSVRIKPVIKSQLHTTPRRDHQISTPGTPLSPTTAYLMSAPIDSLDISKLTGMESPEQKGHPFSLVPVNVDPSSPQVKRSLVVDGSHLKAQPQFLEPLSALPPIGDTSSDPFIAETKLKKKEATIKGKRPKQNQKDYSQSRILQTRKTQPKMVALGGDPARVELERQREKLRKMGIDLTPGMESGNRPPKSGMQMNASQRFLG